MGVPRVVYHREVDGWWAESPDVEGWSAAADSFPELEALVFEGLVFAVGRKPGRKRLNP